MGEDDFQQGPNQILRKKTPTREKTGRRCPDAPFHSPGTVPKNTDWINPGLLCSGQVFLLGGNRVPNETD